jgi:hypothetical protein
MVTPTIIRLIGLGILSATDNPEMMTADISRTVTDPRVDILSDRVRALEDRLSDEVRSIAESAIEQAIAPVQSDLAELLLRVDGLEATATIGEKATSPKPKKEFRSPSDELPAEVLKVVDRLRREPDLLAALKAELAAGGTSSEIGDRLLATGFGTSNGGPHSPAAISLFRAAIVYLGGA